jgi:hypothetical protein
MQNQQWRRRFSVIDPLVLASFLLALPHLAPAKESLSADGAPLGRTQPICGESAGSKSGPSYLSSEESMELRTGTWGRSVHPLSPNFYRYQRDKREQELLTPDCQKKFQREDS